MQRLSDSLTPTLHLELAIHTKGPSFLARVFADHAGQFYNRSDFDALARQVSDLYASRDAEDACSFRSRLNHRLYDRYHAPVIWETEARNGESR